VERVGRRILIFGVTGSGKSTLARRLGAALGVPVVELDAIRHARGWDSTPFDLMRERVTELLDGGREGWVCEGNYRRVRDIPLSRADTVLWLRLPWRVSFARLLRRTVVRGISGAPVYGPEGPRESLRKSFFDKDSILWWSIHHHRKSIASVQRALDEVEHGARVIVLCTPAEVEALASRAENDPS
jgi:adenylate kinase family enzyme